MTDRSTKELIYPNERITKGIESTPAPMIFVETESATEITFIHDFMSVGIGSVVSKLSSSIDVSKSEVKNFTSLSSFSE
eukprot:CAMPEP_0116918844 /NCGR_PEP_ID=MMETSP0467-20121206/20011_1 /TAXON_ID=283647 /ORGANISM="Mesodinium pulex, Strain SPMC105" /LENGTH=78 /DNA_ID=CAMNT_0004596267 /DNA_START=1212 /DNA_END=1448 /DNA_ORIENTATION=+